MKSDHTHVWIVLSCLDQRYSAKSNLQRFSVTTVNFFPVFLRFCLGAFGNECIADNGIVSLLIEGLPSEDVREIEVFKVAPVGDDVTPLDFLKLEHLEGGS